MEIERKFLVRSLPDDLNTYPHDEISQAYISTDPVIRIRKKNDRYILTLKSSGLLARQETELEISQKSYLHLLSKTEGNIIEKTRYRIPEKDSLTIELDIFHGAFEGCIMAEVEFPDLDCAKAYLPPTWFGKDVTRDPSFHNSSLCRMESEKIEAFVNTLLLTQS